MYDSNYIVWNKLGTICLRLIYTCNVSLVILLSDVISLGDFHPLKIVIASDNSKYLPFAPVETPVYVLYFLLRYHIGSWKIFHRCLLIFSRWILSYVWLKLHSMEHIRYNLFKAHIHMRCESRNFAQRCDFNRRFHILSKLWSPVTATSICCLLACGNTCLCFVFSA